MADDTTVVKKKRVNSKAKGSGFENSIAKKLSALLAPMNFRRSQSSGAILGGQNAKMIENFSIEAMTLFIGDVVPSNESDVLKSEGWKFPFSLECKFYKTIDDLEYLLTGSKIEGWMKQAEGDAAKLKKIPLLVFKFNRSKTFCATSWIEKDGTSTKPLLPKGLKNQVLMVRELDDGGTYYITIFELDVAVADVDWWKDKQ